MKKSITQEFEYGCGIACYAFVAGRTYKDAALVLGLAQAQSTRFWVKDLKDALNRAGLAYKSLYIKPRKRHMIYQEGAIVLIRRSERYPSGHYLVRHNNQWMDPWINLRFGAKIVHAQSGYRRRLPGSPMYAIIPMADAGNH